VVVKLYRPTYRVVVNGEDITAAVSPRLVSLTIKDEAGIKSDTVELVLSDHLPGQRLEIPPTGAEIEVSIGYAGAARDMGLFIADEITVEGPPDVMRLRGSASVHGRSSSGKLALTAQRSRSWPAGTLLGDLVDTIAREHGLIAAVAATIASIVLPHIDQIAESDINLITRIALEHDALAKPAGGRLVVVVRGESLTASGAPLPSRQIEPHQVTRWAMTGKLRDLAGTVVATYQDVAGGGPGEVSIAPPSTSIAGAGARGDEILAEATQTRRLRRTYPNEAAARLAATAAGKAAKREALQLSVSLPGDPDLIAEGRLTLAGFRPGVDRQWVIKSVSHVIDASGYRCSVTAELPE
jgi:phage protein D